MQVGCMGFCMGGALSFLAGQEADVDAVAPFYGTPDPKLAKVCCNPGCKVRVNRNHIHTTNELTLTVHIVSRYAASRSVVTAVSIAKHRRWPPCRFTSPYMSLFCFKRGHGACCCADTNTSHSQGCKLLHEVLSGDGIGLSNRLG